MILGDVWRWATGGVPKSVLQDVGPAFEVSSSSVDPALFGLTTWAVTTAPAPRISRREAIQVPAVKRVRDLIPGSLGTLPLRLVGPDKREASWPLLEQPERAVPRSVTMIRTLEDMLFEGVAWWRIVEFGWHTYPTKVERVDVGRVNQQDGKTYVDGRHVPDANLIRFYSPNDALLEAGARAIRTALKLDSAAANYAEEPMPTGYFEPREGADPVEDDDVTDLLDDWQAARQKRSTAYVPAALKYTTVQWSPEQLQLADARQHAVLEIARCAGVDPEDLGVSTTSRTYQNGVDRRRDFLDFTCGAYLSAVQDRLSMADVTQRGYQARFDLAGFLRSNTKERMETYQLGLAVGAYAKDEIRQLEDRPALTAAQTAANMPTEPEEAPADART